MRSFVSTFGVALLLAMACYAPTVVATPPAHAPAHGWRAKNRYVYYPQAQVYYAPDRRLYFWLEGNGWRTGVRLPTQITIDSDRGISLELEATRPYLEHAETARRYPTRGR